MIVRRKKREKMGVREPNPEHVKCRGHIQWIKGCDCLLDKHPQSKVECFGVMDAHHVRHDRNRDDRTVPVCRAHHTEIHALGPDTAEAKFRLDDAASDGWRYSPHGQRYRREHGDAP